MEVTSPGVVTLDTTVVPDVFGLHAFDNRAPVARCCLVSSRTRSECWCLVENFSNTPDYHVQPVSARDITLLKRRWPSSLFAGMNKRQVEMESLCRECQWEFYGEFGGSRAGTCPHCGIHVIANLSRHIMDFHLELGQLWPCSVWKGTAQECMDHLRVRHKADSSV